MTGEPRTDFSVNPLDALVGDRATAHPGLVRDQNARKTLLLQRSQCLSGAREQANPSWVVKIVNMLDHGPFTIEEHGRSGDRSTGIENGPNWSRSDNERAFGRA